MDSSMGSSGGITLVMIIVQFSSSLKRSLSGFCTAPIARHPQVRYQMDKHSIPQTQNMTGGKHNQAIGNNKKSEEIW